MPMKILEENMLKRKLSQYFVSDSGIKLLL